MQKSALVVFILSFLFITQAIAADLASVKKLEARIDKNKLKKKSVMDLSGHDFTQYTDLHHFNFVSANLKGANFSGMRLEGLDFDNAILKNANFKDAELTRSNFHNTDLTGTRFDNAKIKRLNFSNSKMLNTHFDNAALEATIFDNSQMECIYFDNAVIKRASFRGVNAHGLSFFNTNMTSTNKENAVWQTDMQHCLVH